VPGVPPCASGGNGSDGRVFIKVPSTNAYTISVTPGTNTVVPQPDGSVIANFSVSGCFIVD
jgi:hypothetical protein